MIAAGALAALLLAGPAAGDRIEFDAAGARTSAYLDSMMAATEECMHDDATRVLFAGVRSRTTVVADVIARCGPGLRRALAERGGFTAAQANAAVETMAYRATDATLRANGAKVR